MKHFEIPNILSNNKLFKANTARLFTVLALTFLFVVSTLAKKKPDFVAQTVPASFVSDGCSQFPDSDYVDC